MLEDISNQCQPTLDPMQARPKQSFESTGPSDCSSKELALSSSSSPSRLTGSSSPFFPSTNRLDAFHASSSPAPSNIKLLSTPTKRSTLLDSLPPSSPSFGLDLDLDLEDLGPDRQSVQDDQRPTELVLERGTVLYFGRKAKKAIPRIRSPGYSPTEQSVPVLLPKSAKNASRIHCSARIVKEKGGGAGTTKRTVTLEVRVTGQNGMRIDGQLWKQGQLARLNVESGRRLEFAFWGWDANVKVVGSARPKEKKKQLSNRANSSSLDSLTEDGEDAEEEEDHEDAADHGPSKRSRLSSPTSSLSSVSSSPVLSAASTRALSLASSSDLDLPGLLASTIVFHPRSTVGVDELVRALLKESGPQLWQVLSDDRAQVEQLKETSKGEEEAVRAWTPVCQDVLKRERMFGEIDNRGLKDAAGRPLPPYYYYIPDLDNSRARVEALEPFVKRVRGARTSKPIRYFWAKPK